MGPLTQAELRELLTYDPETGIFVWRPRRYFGLAGQVAGTIHGVSGYRYINIRRRVILAHRLAWLYVHGEWPESQIDHINGDRTDNRIANLRLATPAQNGWNSKKKAFNTSGYKGVTWHRSAGKWRAAIIASGKHHSLGLFDSKEDAAAAYAAAAKRLHGDFAQTKR